jgi:uncharacterized protein (TIGR03435 family)
MRPGNITGSLSTLQLVFALSRVLARPVTDETGLTGQYDFALRWMPDAGEPRDPRADVPDPAGPSIFTALQEVGLRLEPKKLHRVYRY